MYRDEFRSYEDRTWWSLPRVAVFIVAGGLMIAAAFGIVGSITYFASDAASMAQKELGVSALLRKYEWFKDASAQLDAKQADIGVYQSRLSGLSTSYAGVARSKWPRDDREQYSIWSSEVAGLKANYNDLAAQYNAQMVKINWSFTNSGELPRGASRVLPREYKPYESQ